MRSPLALGRTTMAALIAIGFVTVLAAGWWLVGPQPHREYREVEVPAQDYKLAGYLSDSDRPGDLFVVFVHGNRPGGQGHPLYTELLSQLRTDVTVLAIDMKGFGSSRAGGAAASQRQSGGFDRLEDIEAAVSFLTRGHGAQEDQIVLVGHSLGALQVLRAADSASFRSVIAIGPADFSLFLADQAARSSYRAKYEQNTGVELSEDVFLQEASRFVPESLFVPCPRTPVVLAFAQWDISERLDSHAESTLEACQHSIEWIYIPLADHMYGSEGTRWPDPLEPLLSRAFIKLLAWNLNRAIGR